MENKEEKKGFWGSMFGSKSGSCCGSLQIEEVDKESKDEQKVENEEEKGDNEAEKVQRPSFPSCGCSGGC